MQLTSNYQLKKPEGTDVVNIDDFNTNADIMDNALKVHDTQLLDLVYQTAGGSGTAITLTIKGVLVNGYPITFVANANNGGSTTTINGKKLYKQNTTISPNLIAGKAYTIWYNSSGDCFFIKASAEGTALAKDVRKNTTFSNDNDTGIEGGLDLSLLVSGNLRAGVTIDGVSGKASVVDTVDASATAAKLLLNTSAYVNGSKVNGNMPNHSGIDSPANSIAGTGAGRIYVRPQYGYYDGSVASYVDDANFIASNIVSGKSIFGIGGSATIASLGGAKLISGTTISTTNSNGDLMIPTSVLSYIPNFLYCRFYKTGTTPSYFLTIFDFTKNLCTMPGNYERSSSPSSGYEVRSISQYNGGYLISSHSSYSNSIYSPLEKSTDYTIEWFGTTV